MVLFLVLTALYIAISIKTKIPFVALIYLMCESLMLFGTELKEYQAYYLVFVAYSYLFMIVPAIKNKITCAIILLLAIACANESNLYGVGGEYIERKTYFYQNIEYLAFCAHLIFIGSFISVREIRNGLRGFADWVGRYKNHCYFINFI